MNLNVDTADNDNSRIAMSQNVAVLIKKKQYTSSTIFEALNWPNWKKLRTNPSETIKDLLSLLNSPKDKRCSDIYHWHGFWLN